MATYAAPVLYAVLLWWFSTGLILLLDHAPRRTHPWSMAGATLLLAGALVAIRSSAADTSATGAYTAFTAALVVWGWQEMSYYMGFLSGPRP
jgi:putative photosynthetic complex assembly protein 2